MITQLAHLCIHAVDLAATERFYVDTLGLERGMTFMKDGNLFGFYLKLGAATYIEVFKGQGSPGGAMHHMAIEVDDIDDAINRLRAGGYEATDKKMGPDGTWQGWTADPDGVKIEFHQYTDASLQYSDGVCEVNW